VSNDSAEEGIYCFEEHKDWDADAEVCEANAADGMIENH
jgi:hypothetical protein